MNFINTKFNRYIIPPICILVIAILVFSIPVRLSSDGVMFVVMGASIVAGINIFLYILFQFLSKSFIKNDFLSIFACSSSSFLLSGTVFRILHWPSALLQLSISGILFVLAAILLLFISKNRNKKA